MIVLKFGGTSLGSCEAMKNVVEILKGLPRQEKTPVVVVSAFSGVTDSLIELSKQAACGDAAYGKTVELLKKRHMEEAAHFLRGKDMEAAAALMEKDFAELLHILDGISILRELSPRSLDLVSSFGERLSAPLLASVLSVNGLPAVYVDSRTLIKTNADFGKAIVLENETFPLIRSWYEPLAKNGPLPVVTGFIARAPDGSTTTLGRGGSDLSAAIFGAALGAGEVEIWTDVDGILTADPKQVKNAFSIDSISYEEAMELSHFGTKVIYPSSILPAMEKDIPIRIKNTFNPGCEGTRIINKAAPSLFPIRGISSISSIALIRLQGPAMVGVAGFSSRLFGALARRKISVILITQSSSE